MAEKPDQNALVSRRRAALSHVADFTPGQLGVLALGTVSGVAVIAAIVGLIISPGLQWATPLVVSMLGALFATAQGFTQREHTEKLAMLGDQLSSQSMQFERRLDAFAEVTRAMRELLENADSVVRSVDTNRGTPGEMPCTWFFQGSAGAIDRLQTNGEILTLRSGNT